MNTHLAERQAELTPILGDIRRLKETNNGLEEARDRAIQKAMDAAFNLKYDDAAVFWQEAQKNDLLVVQNVASLWTAHEALTVKYGEIVVLAQQRAGLTTELNQIHGRR